MDANNGIYRSTDNGISWILNPLGMVGSLCSDGTTLYLTNPPVVAMDPFLYYSNDAGATWIQSTLNTPGNSNPYGNLYFTGNSMLFISAQSGMYEGQGIWRSTNHGVSWTRVLANYGGGRLTFGENIMYVSGVYTNPNSGDQIPSMYKSENDGLTWANLIYLENSLEATLTASGSDVFAATATYAYGLASDSKIMMSSDKCVTWTDVSTGWLFNKIPVISMTILNNRIYAATSGGSIWQRNIDELTLPAQPSAIAGAAAPCANTTQTYSVDNVPTTTYTWQLPADWTIISGQTTNSITVTVGSQSGFIAVSPSNNFGIGLLRIISVSSLTAPVQTSVISGLAAPISGTSQVYSVENVAGTTYTWTFPGDWILTTGGTSNSITVTIGELSGNISVVPSNNCGEGTVQSLVVVAQPNGIDDLSSNNSVSVYPNPCNGVFNALITSATPEIFSIQVYNTVGDLVYEKNKVPVSGNVKLSIDMQSVPSGIYMIKFTAGTEKIIRKMVIICD